MNEEETLEGLDFMAPEEPEPTSKALTLSSLLLLDTNLVIAL